jgi:putative membrane protein
MTERRLAAEISLSQNDENAARSIAKGLRAQLGKRRELAHALKRLDTFEGDVMEARQRLALTERELLGSLDREARAVIAASARRVSIVTALSPFAVVDVGFVAYENIRMLRRLAVLYGGRPGTLAMLRLLRLVTGHLALTGGLAVTDDFIHQLVGQGLTARLSSRLGEGVVNGAFTVRIGLAAIDVLRPLPYIEASPPRLRDFLTDVFRKPATDPASGAKQPAGSA